MVKRFFAAVGNDGMRPVVWGLGYDETEALVDGGCELDQVDAPWQPLEAHEITEAQDAVVRAGDVSWPIVVAEQSCDGCGVEGVELSEQGLCRACTQTARVGL